MARLFREPQTQYLHVAGADSKFIQPGVVEMESDGGSRQENSRAAHLRGIGIVQALGSFCKGQTWKDSAAGLHEQGIFPSSQLSLCQCASESRFLTSRRSPEKLQDSSSLE